MQTDEHQMPAPSLEGLIICFAGAGSMAEAIIRGLIATKTSSPAQIYVINRSNQDTLIRLKEQYGIQPAMSQQERDDAVSQADILLLAMKPKDAEAALESLKLELQPETLLVSVIAGLPIRSIKRVLARETNIVRAMPNTSSTIGWGATGICFSQGTNETKRRQAEILFHAVGNTVIVEEELMNTVTGISGSGPAYFYYMMEALIAAGVDNGLDYETAKQLTVQTILGAANMVKITGESPQDLRKKVTSPGGTTQAAIESLDQSGVYDALRQAAKRATARAGEIEQELFGE